uniref:TrkH family potassium uptake protein n=1 Tax=Pseudomonas sp. TaxID=306 RepID=UPI003CC588F5
ASFAFYHKPSLNWIATLFMFLGGINFALHYAALRGDLHHSYLHDEECRTYIGWLLALMLLLWLVGVTADVRWDQMVFTLVSIATSTGFVNCDYSLWPPAALLLVAAAMFVGASAGSTAGGLKIIRMMLLSRQGVMELKRFLHPTAILHVKANHRTVPPHVIQSLWAFAVLYILVIVVLSLLVAMSGVDLLTAVSASLTCISNTGPGFGLVGPVSNYQSLPELTKLLLVVGMIAGRLEIFTLLLVLSPFFWRK